ncbi:mitochondrial aspartate-glutamate transporter agc1, partial [Linderina macrospora]
MATAKTETIQVSGPTPAVRLLAKLGNGAVAGITGVSIIYPLDMVKTRLQNQKPNAQGKLPYKGVVDCFKTIVRTEGGIRGLYRGLVPNLAGITPEKALKLAVNDIMRGVLAKRSNTTPERLSVRDGAIAGATAGFCQVVATNPMEIVKIQMQVSATTGAGGAQITAMQVVRQLGLRGMYKGTAATLLRDVPFSLLFFPSQALFSQKLHQFFNGGKEGEKPATLCVLGGSTIAGILAAGAVTPADVVKTRLQSSSQPSPPYRGLADTA